MRTLLVALSTLLLLPSLTLAQADSCSEVQSLRALYDVRQAMLLTSPSSYDINRRIEYHLDRLREPLPGGGYRWVRLVRPSGDGPVQKREKLLRATYGSSEIFEADSPLPYSVRIVVPRKRSLVRANNEVWVGDVRIRYWSGGRVETMDRTVNAWLKPDNSRTFDLGVIADRAEVEVETATRAQFVGDALVEVHFRQAVAEDDPMNPNAEGIRALTRLHYSTDPVALDLEIARLEQRLFPGIDVTPFATVVARVREAETLLRSEKEEDREKGKKVLAEVIRTLPR
jgi:hypothetical protein